MNNINSQKKHFIDRIKPYYHNEIITYILKKKRNENVFNVIIFRNLKR